MTTRRDNDFWSAIAIAWPLWWRLSSGWVVVLLTLWLLPSDFSHEWIGGPSQGFTLGLVAWLVFPPASALLLMLIQGPISSRASRAREFGGIVSSGPLSRIQKLIVIGLLLFTAVVLLFVLDIMPGPKKFENFVQSLMADQRNDVASERSAIQKSAGEPHAVKPTTIFDVFFDEVSQEDKEAEKSRLENELRELQSGQALEDDIRRLKRAIEAEKARLECEKQPESCGNEAPDEQN